MFAKVDAGSMFENAVYNNLKLLGGINYYQKRSRCRNRFYPSTERNCPGM
ncbi:MAG: hypothetical protein R6U52_09505 [Kosmotogaceae bacterium]